jgi:hypothetical protein
MKGAARLATDLALSPMTGKGPKRYGIRIPSGEPANRRWVLEQGWIKANAEPQEVTMTRSSGNNNTGKASPEAAAAMRDFTDGIHSHAHFRYAVDGTWSELDKTFHATLDDIFGPESPNSAIQDLLEDDDDDDLDIPIEVIASYSRRVRVTRAV